VEGEFGEVEGRNVLGGLGVPLVEVSYEPPHAIEVFSWSPFVLLNSRPPPSYEVLMFSLEDPAVQDLFYFIFLDSVVGGGWVVLYSFSDGICIVGP